MAKKKLTLKEKVDQYMEAEMALAKSHGLTKQLVITFPYHTKTPLRGRLGVWLLSTCKAKIDTLFAEK